jgi:hypothetical protein
MATKNRPTFDRIIERVGDCIPVTYAYNSKHGAAGCYIIESGAKRICRETCLAHHGPRPSAAVVRHLCENDSTAPNGFVCCNPEHIKWDSAAANIKDIMTKGKHISQSEEFHKSDNKKIGGIAATSKVRVCEHCGHIGKYPSFGFHIRKCSGSR